MSREAMKLALDAFDSMVGRKPERVEQAIIALREALAEQPAQPTIPDPLTPADKESPEYTDGWNDCRQAMLAS